MTRLIFQSPLIDLRPSSQRFNVGAEHAIRSAHTDFFLQIDHEQFEEALGRPARYLLGKFRRDSLISDLILLLD